MPINLVHFELQATQAIKHFWSNRDSSKDRQIQTGKIDQGARGSVTAGANMNGFIDLIHKLAAANGMPDASIIRNGHMVTLPGYFRPTKRWDLLLIHNGVLIAAIELKSQVGSFGNNFNNRTEEAIGTSHDFWVAYREGAFGESPKPFIGWLMLLEDCVKSRTPVNDRSPHFPLFKEFKGASYADRYDILCKRMVREQLYTAACLLLAPSLEKEDGSWSCLSEMTNLKSFVAELGAHIASVSARFEK